ncbi:MAG: hypothetical protein EPN23_02555 [Verrucomicrobia bacterium]|nr:MAG: hypothetical protein EPN23_02555 [Verrucomicrobiota bacterium]
MKLLRILLICALGAALCAVLQLPDPLADRPEAEYVNLPDADFAEAASTARNAGLRGPALLLIDYSIEQQLGDSEECLRLREGFVAALQRDFTVFGKLQALGLMTVPSDANWFESLSGNSVADFFIYGAGAAEVLPVSASSDAFLAAAQGAQALTPSFPPLGPAIKVIVNAHTQGVLNRALTQQLTDALQFVRAASSTALAIGAAQESIMPIYQLARQCKTWAEFEVLLRNTDSVDQIKALTRIAAGSPRSARRLAQALVVAGGQGAEAKARALGFVLQHGAKGFDALHAALRKGPAGVALLVKHPALPVAQLNLIRRSTPFLFGEAGLAWWRSQQAQLGWGATFGKYATIAVLCGVIFVLLLPRRLFREKFLPVTPLARASAEQADGIYWSIIALSAIAVCLMLVLPAVAPAGGADETTGGVPGASGNLMATTGSFMEHNQALSLLILLAVIMIVQGACLWVARRKIREIEQDADAAPVLKLRRLENLDIFFDLPLYCGLALTIFAFILISTFGAGVSRFLAYSSTFIGILFAVILRVGHLYPLREKLINQKG